jgi:hypothetical protein
VLLSEAFPVVVRLYLAHRHHLAAQQTRGLPPVGPCAPASGSGASPRFRLVDRVRPPRGARRPVRAARGRPPAPPVPPVPPGLPPSSGIAGFRVLASRLRARSCSCLWSSLPRCRALRCCRACAPKGRVPGCRAARVRVSRRQLQSASPRRRGFGFRYPASPAGGSGGVPPALRAVGPTGRCAAGRSSPPVRSLLAGGVPCVRNPVGGRSLLYTVHGDFSDFREKRLRGVTFSLRWRSGLGDSRRLDTGESPSPALTGLLTVSTLL